MYIFTYVYTCFNTSHRYAYIYIYIYISTSVSMCLHVKQQKMHISVERRYKLAGDYALNVAKQKLAEAQAKEKAAQQNCKMKVTAETARFRAATSPQK